MAGSSRGRPAPAGPPTSRQLTLGWVATALLGAEALILGALATYYVYGLVTGQGSDPLVVIMSIVTLVVFTVGLAYVAVGLWQRHPRAQAPAIAVNFLLVPLGIAMFQFAPPLLAAAILLTALASIGATLGMGQLQRL